MNLYGVVKARPSFGDSKHGGSVVAKAPPTSYQARNAETIAFEAPPSFVVGSWKQRSSEHGSDAHVDQDKNIAWDANSWNLDSYQTGSDGNWKRHTYEPGSSIVVDQQKHRTWDSKTWNHDSHPPTSAPTESARTPFSVSATHTRTDADRRPPEIFDNRFTEHSSKLRYFYCDAPKCPNAETKFKQASRGGDGDGSYLFFKGVKQEGLRYYEDLLSAWENGRFDFTWYCRGCQKYWKLSAAKEYHIARVEYRFERTTQAPDAYQASILGGKERSEATQALANDGQWRAVRHLRPADSRWKLVFQHIYAACIPAELFDLPRLLYKYSADELAWWERLVMKFGYDAIIQLTENALWTVFRNNPITQNVPPKTYRISLPS